MTDPRTPTSDPVAAAWEALLDCGDDAHGDSMAEDIARHRPLIEAEARQQARAAFAAQVAELPDVAIDRGLTGSAVAVSRAEVLALLAAHPEPASPEAPGSGLDVERLARALYGVHAYRTLDDAKEVARDIAREYDRLAARPDGAEADAS